MYTGLTDIDDMRLMGTICASLCVVGTLFALSQPVAATPIVPSYVQSDGDLFASMSPSKALPVAVTQGNLMVATVTWHSSSGGTMSCSDNRGNAYTTVTTRYHPIEEQSLSTCYTANATGGATTVTAAITAPSSDYTTMIVSEYSGVAISNPVDAYGTTAGSHVAGPDSVTIGPFTTYSNGDLIYVSAF